jgi:L-aminopeptidase/D-esterase-like protein
VEEGSVGDELGDDNPMEGFFGAPPGAGSIITVVVTDVPLFPGQCSSMARRVTSGIARTGHRVLVLPRERVVAIARRRSATA